MNTTIKQELSHEEMLKMDREEAREEMFELRKNWLEEKSCKESDVLTNSYGEEYVVMTDWDGSDFIEMLPAQLQISSIDLNF